MFCKRIESLKTSSSFRLGICWNILESFLRASSCSFDTPCIRPYHTCRPCWRSWGTCDVSKMALWTCWKRIMYKEYGYVLLKFLDLFEARWILSKLSKSVYFTGCKPVSASWWFLRQDLDSISNVDDGNDACSAAIPGHEADTDQTVDLQLSAASFLRWPLPATLGVLLGLHHWSLSRKWPCFGSP